MQPTMSLKCCRTASRARRNASVSPPLLSSLMFMNAYFPTRSGRESVV